MNNRKFRFGVSARGRGDTLEGLKDFARKAEDLGYDVLIPGLAALVATSLLALLVVGARAIAFGGASDAGGSGDATTREG